MLSQSFDKSSDSIFVEIGRFCIQLREKTTLAHPVLAPENI
jgi:hypothetical protein